MDVGGTQATDWTRKNESDEVVLFRIAPSAQYRQRIRRPRNRDKRKNVPICVCGQIHIQRHNFLHGWQ